MSSATLQHLTQLAVAFRDQRDWKQFHNPKDIALSLTLEAAEVLEHMQWRNGPQLEAHLATKREELGDELSDVLYWVLVLAHDQGIDLGTAFAKKLEKSAVKYPVAKARGKFNKYTEL
jgi:dCTP diphosphatase